MLGYVHDTTKIWDPEFRKVASCSDLFNESQTAYISCQDNEHNILGLPKNEPIYTEVLEGAPVAAQPMPPGVEGHDKHAVLANTEVLEDVPVVAAGAAIVEGREKQATQANATPDEAVDAMAKRTPNEVVAAPPLSSRTHSKPYSRSGTGAENCNESGRRRNNWLPCWQRQ